jgi:hypothetical protein
MYARVLSCVLAALVAVAACVDVNSNYFGPPPGAGGGGTGGPGAGGQGAGGGLTLDSGMQGPPPADASGLCGNEIHPITSQPPTVYFLFDISGSMSTQVPGGTRFSVEQAAAAGLVDKLRYVIRAGAAAFPLETEVDQCHVGGEIYPAQFDDPVGFDEATIALQPNGGTPTAATITSLIPKLSALPGKTILVLSTDGGPNCNADLSCTAAECSENLDGCDPGDTCCAMNLNCCAPSGPAGPLNCVDEADTVAAVKAMAMAGVKVYVIGIPGSQSYANVLTAMALAGGAPMGSAPFYYDVQDLSTLGPILETIAGAAVSCDITIADPPMMQGDTNVYFGNQIVLYDPVNGWTWSAPNVITLNGAACTELRSGAVSQVQVVSGCPTQATK